MGRSYWIYTQGIIRDLKTMLWCWSLFLHQSLVFFFERDSGNLRHQGGAEEAYGNRGNKQGKAETKHWDTGWKAKPQILPSPYSFLWKSEVFFIYIMGPTKIFGLRFKVSPWGTKNIAQFKMQYVKSLRKCQLLETAVALNGAQRPCEDVHANPSYYLKLRSS